MLLVISGVFGLTHHSLVSANQVTGSSKSAAIAAIQNFLSYEESNILPKTELVYGPPTNSSIKVRIPDDKPDFSYTIRQYLTLFYFENEGEPLDPPRFLEEWNENSGNFVIINFISPALSGEGPIAWDFVVSVTDSNGSTVDKIISTGNP